MENRPRASQQSLSITKPRKCSGNAGGKRHLDICEHAEREGKKNRGGDGAPRIQWAVAQELSMDLCWESKRLFKSRNHSQGEANRRLMGFHLSCDLDAAENAVLNFV